MSNAGVCCPTDGVTCEHHDWRRNARDRKSTQLAISPGRPAEVEPGSLLAVEYPGDTNCAGDLGRASRRHHTPCRQPLPSDRRGALGFDVPERDASRGS